MSHRPKESDAPTSYALEDQVGYLLRLVNQRHALIFQKLISADLTPTQFSAMLRISEMGEVSQNRLGRLTAIDIATVKGVVDRLRDKGLVQRRSDPGDKRRSLISLTDKGLGMIDRMKSDGLSVSAETMAALDAEEQQTLVSLLKKLL